MERIKMTCDAFLEKLLKTYALIKVLSDKNESKTLLIENKNLKKRLILHVFNKHFEAYSILNQIKCDNLPEVYDVIPVEDGEIVLEEYIEGLTVAEIMETGKYSPSGAKKVLYEICKGLYILHNNGIVHRDIKPENIVIDKKGRTVLIDFNASRTVKAATKDTVVMGTVGYASPEQLGITQTDARTDIYAIGILLNVMLTGEHPSKIMAKGKLGNIIKKCTNLNPDDRFQSVKELADFLK